VVWHHLLLLMNRFNKTEVAVFKAILPEGFPFHQFNDNRKIITISDPARANDVFVTSMTSSLKQRSTQSQRLFLFKIASHALNTSTEAMNPPVKYVNISLLVVLGDYLTGGGTQFL